MRGTKPIGERTLGGVTVGQSGQWGPGARRWLVEFEELDYRTDVVNGGGPTDHASSFRGQQGHRDLHVVVINVDWQDQYRASVRRQRQCVALVGCGRTRER